LTLRAWRKKVLQKNPRRVLQPDGEVCKMRLANVVAEIAVKMLLSKSELFVDDVSND